MNITVINGTEKHGVTYRLKEMFLAAFRDKADMKQSKQWLMRFMSMPPQILEFSM